MTLAMGLTLPIRLTKQEVRERILNQKHLWYRAHLLAQKIGLKVTFGEEGDLTIEGVYYPLEECASCIVRRGCGIMRAIKKNQRTVFWHLCDFSEKK